MKEFFGKKTCNLNKKQKYISLNENYGSKGIAKFQYNNKTINNMRLDELNIY